MFISLVPFKFNIAKKINYFKTSSVMSMRIAIPSYCIVLKINSDIVGYKSCNNQKSIQAEVVHVGPNLVEMKTKSLEFASVMLCSWQ